jgi:transposase
MMQLLVGAIRICAVARHQQRLLSTDDIAAFRTVYDALVREG